MNTFDINVKYHLHSDHLCSSFAYHPYPDSLSSLREYKAGIDSQIVCSSSQSSEVVLYNISNEQNIRKFKFSGHKGGIMSVAYSKQGDIMGSVGEDKSIKLWNPNKMAGDHTHIPCAHTGTIRGIDFSTDVFLTCSDDKTIKLWNLRKTNEKKAFISSLVGHSNWVRSCKFSPEGNLSASGGDDGTVRLWDISTGSTLVKYAPFQSQTFARSSIHKVDFHSSGSLLAAATNVGSKVLIFDLRTDSQICAFQEELEQTQISSCGISFHPSNSNQIITRSPKYVTLWDIRSKKKLSQVETECNNDQVTPFCLYSPCGNQFATNSDYGLTVWNLNPSNCDKRCQPKKVKSKETNSSHCKTDLVEDIKSEDTLEMLKSTIEKITSQLDLLTETVIAIERRLSIQERKVDMLLDPTAFTTNVSK